MKLTRRDAISLGLGATAASFLPMRGMAAADSVIETFTKGASVGSGDLMLTITAMSESKDGFEITVDAPGAKSLIVVATGNVAPLVGTFENIPTANPQITTQLRLLETQSVVTIAKMADGSFVQDAVMVTVAAQGSKF